MGRAEIVAVPILSLDEFQQLWGTFDLCVTGDGAMAASGVRSALVRWTSRYPLCRVLVVDRALHQHIHNHSPRAWHYCRSVGGIETEILRIRVSMWKKEVKRRIRSARHLPFVLREALVVVVDQEFPQGLDEEEFTRTMDRAARRVGVSREHLSRVSHATEFDFRGFADSFVCVLALAQHDIDRDPWAGIAGALGYTSQSGLVALFKRSVGQTPTDALRYRPVQDWLDWWEDHVLGEIIRADGHE